MTNQIEPNFVNILNAADSFYGASLSIIKNRKNFKKSSITFVVNAIFAIELYLKAILTYDNINYKNIHNLEKLYNKLSISRRDSLKKKYCYIEDFVKEHKNAFTDWRYYFEYEMLGIANDEILSTLDALRKECDKIKGGMLDE